jgi:hypothetical protein
MIRHRPTNKTFGTTEQARRHYAKYSAEQSPLGVSISLYPDAGLLSALNQVGYYTDTTPEYDPQTHVLTGLFVWDESVYTVAQMIRALTGDEIAANRSAIELMMWEQIKQERERRRVGGVLVAGKWFHSDDQSRIQHLGLMMMGAGLPVGIMWKTMDGSFIELTQSLVGGIFQALAGADQFNFATAETHRIAMEASIDPTLYDFSTGWLDCYTPAGT